MQDKLLDQARELLGKAEKTTDPHSKKALCESALVILDELEDEPGEKEVVIKNMRKSFARSLVRQINNMNMEDVETSDFFLNNFVLKFPKEISELLDENPEYEREMKRLVDIFRSDFE